MGLIHLEGVWSENLLTAQGRTMHERVHSEGQSTRDGVRIVRGLRIRSLNLGLSGVADVVEFHPRSAADSYASSGDASALSRFVGLPGAKGFWEPFPVEYKRGKPKTGDCDEVQLCAQAHCLEEMLGCRIEAGALFYGRTRRRKDVQFSARLRDRTITLAAHLHKLTGEGVTPPGQYGKKCDSCSLEGYCQPKAIRASHSARGYLARALSNVIEEGPCEES